MKEMGAPEAQDSAPELPAPVVASGVSRWSGWRPWLVGLAALGIVAAGAAVYAWPRTPPPRRLSEEEAVEQSIRALGPDAHTEDLAAFAYQAAYPEGPGPGEIASDMSRPYAAAYQRLLAAVELRLGRSAPSVESEAT